MCLFLIFVVLWFVCVGMGVSGIHLAEDNFLELVISFHLLQKIRRFHSGHQICTASTFTYLAILPVPCSYYLLYKIL